MKFSVIVLFVVFTLNGCCLGGIDSVEEITYSRKSSLHPTMTFNEAETLCQVETDGALAIWQRQCAEPALNIEQILAIAPPMAKQFTQPLDKPEQFNWYCDDLQKIKHYHPDDFRYYRPDRRLDSRFRFQLDVIHSSCIKELGFKEYRHQSMGCRASFFG